MNKQKRKNKNVVFRKPSFKKILIKNLAICVCTAILIGVIGTAWTFWEDDGSGLTDSLSDYKESVLLKYMAICEREEVKNLATGEFMSDSEKWEQFKVQAEQYVYENVWYEESWGVIDLNTNEFIMKSSPAVWYYWIESNETGEQTFYQCKDERIISEIQKYWNGSHYDASSWINLRGIYVKGFDFIPGKLTIEKMAEEDLYYDEEGNKVSENDDWVFSTNTEIVAELDFTPEDISGYTYIDENKIDYSSHLSKGNQLYTYDIKESQETLEKSVKEKEPGSKYIGGVEDVKESGWFNSKKEICVYDGLRFEAQGGHIDDLQYQILVADAYNLFEEYEYSLKRGYITLLLLAIVIPCVMSYIQYTRQKSYYEIDQYRRNMTNTMAHDLKSPLMVISGFAENLLETELQDQQRHYTDSILGNVQYMNQIIENILELSKVEHAEYKLQKEEIDLCELTEEITTNYKTQLDEKGLEVQMSGACNIKADKLWMTQVLDNLIGNAVKYAVEGTVVEVSMSDICYKITNTSSVDFDMDVNELVKPFVKGDNSRSGKKGSGIGLTIVENIVEQHGYQFELECVDGQFIVRIVMG